MLILFWQIGNSNSGEEGDSEERNETERISESRAKDSENSNTENTDVKNTERSFEVSFNNQDESEFFDQLPKDITETRTKISLTKRAGCYAEYGSDVNPVISRAEVLNFNIPEKQENFEEDDVYPLSIKYDK